MSRKIATVDLGLRGERVSPGAHIAYFWEGQQQFEQGVGFLLQGFRGNDHGVVFGHTDANKAVLNVITRKGLNLTRLEAEGKLAVLEGKPAGQQMLEEIGGTFSAMVERGARLIRLLGNIGWSREGWPAEDEILEFEANVTTAALNFPCVVVCMYDVHALSGRVIVHGAYGTHPLTICSNVMRENPYYVAPKQFLQELQGKS